MKRYRYKQKKYRHVLTSKHRSRGYQRIRKKKSIFRSRFFWLSFLFLVILGTVFYFVVFSPYFQIKEIKISGNVKVPVEDVRNTISSQVDRNYLRKSIFLADLKGINEMLLEEFPRIAKVSLDRDFPNVLLVQIEERKPVAVFCRQEDYFFIDQAGIVFEKISQFSSQMLNIKNPALAASPELGEVIIEQEELNQILKIEKKLKELKIPLEEILIVSGRRLDVKISEDWEIYFNPEKDLDWQLAKLEILLKERIPPEKRGNLEYIDLRFEKIYIYPENYNQ